ncbi:MAG: glycosyltransferase [Devosia sp. 67-54]|uniref:WecB/TagA/CpsF family glycosyltransferase n=1 Tax=unclassified Devosia TaxID=196773 RepID=UPI00096210A1|nr:MULTISPECIES: WecB/TagA/CpsF family glycosyltransferase [unclassified Devosia]MBN9306537.1 WecB/TagA/CpsF family glycosyltransferase [Devosia sp.]OJX15825.1 MAG: glycosyltransferase [Devosia sp. 67-54]
MSVLDIIGGAAPERDAPTIVLGGLPITVIDRRAEAELMVRLAARRRPQGPLFFTSANGEVIARTAFDPAQAALFALADQIVADGQPLVIASRLLCREPLPERVATTDLFHDVARLAETTGTSFYLFGATEAENARAVAAARAAYPRLDIAGATHGYLDGAALEAKLAEIDALAPDILWLGLGVPREQIFFREHGHRLRHVGMIKTAGGLFDHMAGKVRRAPLLWQRLGFEWLWRLLMEPRRLFVRYLTTNPKALYAMLRNSR